jgi:hypothetical protein
VKINDNGNENDNEYPDELPVLTNDSCDCSSLECFFSRGITLAVLTDLAIFSCESLGCSILSPYSADQNRNVKPSMSYTTGLSVYHEPSGHSNNGRGDSRSFVDKRKEFEARVKDYSGVNLHWKYCSCCCCCDCDTRNPGIACEYFCKPEK